MPMPKRSASKPVSPKAPEPMDREIGLRIRAQRLATGLSQTELAEVLGITFQQVQKYEKGMNRVSPGRLAKIAEKLGVPITFFYDGIAQFSKASGRPRTQSKEANEALALLRTAGSVRLLRAFEQMPDEPRKHFLALVEHLAAR
jgi:transcriptional regulator with XRE-family HTH domain